MCNATGTGAGAVRGPAVGSPLGAGGTGGNNYGVGVSAPRSARAVVTRHGRRWWLLAAVVVGVVILGRSK